MGFELELRFGNLRNCASIIKQLKGGTWSHSITTDYVVGNVTHTFIDKTYVESRTKTQKRFKFVNNLFSKNFKLVLSEENYFVLPQSDHKHLVNEESSDTIIRHKIRLSYKSPSVDLWRYDFTVVLNLPDISQKLTSTNKVKEFIINNTTYPVEVEVEYVGGTEDDENTSGDEEDPFLETAAAKVLSDSPHKVYDDLYNEFIKNEISQRTEKLLQILNIVPNQKYQLMKRLTKDPLSHRGGITTVVNRALSLNIFNYSSLPKHTVLLTKLDGIRSILSVHLSTQSNTVIAWELDTVDDNDPNHVLSHRIDRTKAKINHTVMFDGEWINDAFVIFDLIDFNIRGYLSRIQLAAELIDHYREQIDLNIIVKKPTPWKTKDDIKDLLLETGYLDGLTPKPVNIKNPQYYHVDAKSTDRLLCDTDGLIIVDANPTMYYLETKHYKWKPADKSTADMVFHKTPDGTNQLCSTKGCPYVFMMNPKLTRHAAIRLEDPSLNLEDGLIYEASWSNGGWLVHRKREDKIAPNSVRTVDSIILNAMFPLTSGHLTMEEPLNLEDAYFNSDLSTDEEKMMRKAHNEIKTKIINEYFKDVDVLLDIGSGRGQDINKWNHAGIKKVLVIEKDKFAIYELMSRIYNLGKNLNTEIFIMNADFNVDNLNVKLQDYIEELGIDKPTFRNISIQFAIHYLDQDKLVNFLMTHWSSNGKLFFTVFNKNRVLNLLKQHNNYYWESNSKQISLRLKPDNIIGVKMPFTGTVEYDEPLFDTEEFYKKLKEYLPNLKITLQRSFADYDNINIGSDSIIITSLYDAVVFEH